MDSLTNFRLPRSHWHCVLDAFEWEGVTPVDLRQRVTQFADGVKAGRSPHLLLLGPPGVGKTHLGIGVYRAVAAELGTQLVTWLNVADYCEKVKASYSKTELDPWSDVEDARRLVVLDDLFGRELTMHEALSIVYRLIDTAYRNNAALMATMNQTLDELQARLPPHEISRLLENVVVQEMSAQDHRIG